MNSPKSTAVKASLANVRVRALVFVVVFALLAVGMSAVFTPAARGDSGRCPSSGTPPPGAHVNGGLQVDGTCIVDSVTVNGGILVNGGGHLQLTRSTVHGGIVVLPCGELDVNAVIRSGTPTHTSSTIDGGVAIFAGPVCHAGAFSDVDIWNARINGGISMTGKFSIAFPFFCDNEIKGDVTLDKVSVTRSGTFEGLVGDPDIVFGTIRGCPGNAISGSLHVSNSSFFAIESNTVGGSVVLSGSTLEFNGNTINGSLRCSNGTVIVPGEPADPRGNTVHGSNNC